MTDLVRSTIDPQRLARFLSADVTLRAGPGKGGNGTVDVCVMQAVDWLVGHKGTSDHPPCTDPVIAAFCIRLNDALRFAQWRNELKPFAVRIANTNFGAAVSIKRGFLCTDWTIRTIAPLAFDFWGDLAELAKRGKDRDTAREWAQRLRDVPPITDQASALVARDVARKARDSAASAAYAASAASAAYAASAASAASANSADSAASAAYAAYAASAASANSADYAASAAYAAYAASKVDAFSRRMWDESLAFLARLIAVTETVSA